MQDEKRTQEERFDWARFIFNSLRFLRRTFWLVLAAAILVALLTAGYTYRTHVDRYEARAVLSVRADNNTVTDVIGSGDKTNANFTKQIVNTFATIIQSDAMHDRILRELGTTKINGTITPRVIAESNLFTLSVRSTNAADAYNILNAVIKCYPDMAFSFIGAASIELIEAPVMPAAPVNPRNIVRPAAIGGLIAALAVLAILCLLAQLQTVVSSTADMQRFTNVPCLVHVPQTELKRRAQGSNQLSLRNEHLPPAYVESIRVLGSRVMRQCREDGFRRLVVTSTVPGEGKSTIAANLALSLGRAGLRVVLIDADLRTQELREFFEIEGQPRGLSELLQNPELDPIKCLTPVAETNVQLLCGGRVDRPIAILRRGKLGSLLDRLDEAADIILIDTPPIGLLTDAAVFAHHADAALYVVRSGATAGNRIAEGLQAVSDCRTKILGYVLNGVSAKAGSHGYGYRYSYGYGYGSRYYGTSYGASGYRTDRGSYGNYSHYGNYSSYGSYGGYENYGNESASATQKKTERARKSRKTAESTMERQQRHKPQKAVEAPKQTAEQKPLRETPAEVPKPMTETKPVREAPAERPKRMTETKPVREAPAERPKLMTETKPVREAPAAETLKQTAEARTAAEKAPVRRPAVEAAAPLPKTEMPDKNAAYDDPELDAIVREVLATTTEEDVRRAYETLEAVSHSPRRDAAENSAAVSSKNKSRGLFHRDKK